MALLQVRRPPWWITSIDTARPVCNIRLLACCSHSPGSVQTKRRQICRSRSYKLTTCHRSIQGTKDIEPGCSCVGGIVGWCIGAAYDHFFSSTPTGFSLLYASSAIGASAGGLSAYTFLSSNAWAAIALMELANNEPELHLLLAPGHDGEGN